MGQFQGGGMIRRGVLGVVLAVCALSAGCLGDVDFDAAAPDCEAPRFDAVARDAFCSGTFEVTAQALPSGGSVAPVLDMDRVGDRLVVVRGVFNDAVDSVWLPVMRELTVQVWEGVEGGDIAQLRLVQEATWGFDVTGAEMNAHFVRTLDGDYDPDLDRAYYPSEVRYVGGPEHTVLLNRLGSLQLVNLAPSDEVHEETWYYPSDMLDGVSTQLPGLPPRDESPVLFVGTAVDANVGNGYVRVYAASASGGIKTLEWFRDEEEPLGWVLSEPEDLDEEARLACDFFYEIDEYCQLSAAHDTCDACDGCVGTAVGDCRGYCRRDSGFINESVCEELEGFDEAFTDYFDGGGYEALQASVLECADACSDAGDGADACVEACLLPDLCDSVCDFPVDAGFVTSYFSDAISIARWEVSGREPVVYVGSYGNLYGVPESALGVEGLGAFYTSDGDSMVEYLLPLIDGNARLPEGLVVLSVEATEDRLYALIARDGVLVERATGEASDVGDDVYLATYTLDENGRIVGDAVAERLDVEINGALLLSRIAAMGDGLVAVKLMTSTFNQGGESGWRFTDHEVLVYDMLDPSRPTLLPVALGPAGDARASGVLAMPAPDGDQGVLWSADGAGITQVRVRVSGGVWADE